MTRVHLRPDLARMDLARKDLARKNWSGRIWPATTTRRKAGAPDPRRLVAGGVHHRRCPSGFAVILWRRAHADCRPLGAAARFNATIAAGKSAVSRATRAIYRSSGRGGGSTSASNTPASNNLGSDRTARRRADSACSASRSDAVAANDGARSRESGAKHRTAQGEPAANRQRQFKSHCGAQGEPGRDETRAREGFRAEPAQDVTVSVATLRRSRRRPCASPSGAERSQARARPRYRREWMYDDW